VFCGFGGAFIGFTTFVSAYALANTSGLLESFAIFVAGSFGEQLHVSYIIFASFAFLVFSGTLLGFRYARTSSIKI
jgi:hypothetical protein